MSRFSEIKKLPSGEMTPSDIKFLIEVIDELIQTLRDWSAVSASFAAAVERMDDLE